MTEHQIRKHFWEGCEHFKRRMDEDLMNQVMHEEFDDHLSIMREHDLITEHQLLTLELLP